MSVSVGTVSTEAWVDHGVPAWVRPECDAWLDRQLARESHPPGCRVDGWTARLADLVGFERTLRSMPWPATAEGHSARIEAIRLCQDERRRIEGRQQREAKRAERRTSDERLIRVLQDDGVPDEALAGLRLRASDPEAYEDTCVASARMHPGGDEAPRGRLRSLAWAQLVDEARDACGV